MNKEKEKQAENIINEAISKATVVGNDTDLKTAVRKKVLAIISTDSKLYERLLKKLPKENVSIAAKGLAQPLISWGAVLVWTGIFTIPGLIMLGSGAALEVTGLALDDARNYSIMMDYDNKRVILLKTKGKPKLDLPRGYSMKKLKR